MMLIHGKVTTTEVTQGTDLEGKNFKQIVFVLNDESQHKYLYKNNSLFFIIQENEEEVKYITICENIDDCSFTYENNRLTTAIEIGDITYRNNFNL